jgi:putative GTP pyrophosphokinase
LLPVLCSFTMGTMDDFRPEYDLTTLRGATRGKHLKAYRAGTNLALMASEARAATPTDVAVVRPRPRHPTLKWCTMPLSKTQIDRLGDRLKGGPHTDSDLRLLDEYRRSFGEAYEAVVKTIRQRGMFPTGRLAKSTVSIAEKLRRESIRLSQMQDIAGCRVVVVNVLEQERCVGSLKTDFPGASVIDRRDNPSHGYRAVHIIAEKLGKPIEIQVRSALQHLWAEVSEKSSDVLDPTIKYGGGTDSWRTFLTKSSESVAAYEVLEEVYSKAAASKEVADASHERFKKAVAELREHHIPEHELQEIQGKLGDSTREMVRRDQRHQEMRAEMERLWNVNADLLSGAISRLEVLKGQQQ